MCIFSIKVHYKVIEILAVRWLVTKLKLAGRSPGNDDEVSHGNLFFTYIEYCTGGLVRSENEARKNIHR